MKTNNEVMSAKNKNTEVQELKKQLQEIQQKLEEIEKENSKECNDNCLIKNVSVNHQGYFYLEYWRSEFTSVEVGGNSVHPMHFADEEQCKRYAEALTTFILLRKQPGSEVAKDKELQYIIDCNMAGNLVIEECSISGFKIGNISPCFNSEESARKAIETLGEERILNMLKYFHS